jgi:hypothetical protein
MPAAQSGEDTGKLICRAINLEFSGPLPTLHCGHARSMLIRSGLIRSR